MVLFAFEEEGAGGGGGVRDTRACTEHTAPSEQLHTSQSQATTSAKHSHERTNARTTA